MAQVLVTYPDALATALARAQAEHGATVIDDLVTNYLRDRERVFEDQDIAEVREGRADAPTRARVRARLGL